MSSHVEICPICRGSGKYKEYDQGLSTYTYIQRTCHGCEGKGWITVSDVNPYNHINTNGEINPDILNHITHIDSNLED